MFTGMSDHSIDSKGRIVLPSRFREQLGEKFIIAKGFSKCVQVLSIEEFENLRANIKKLPAKAALALQYSVIATSVEVTPNSQGRIPIPQKLRELASLEKEAVVVGVDNRIEIWDKAEFDKMLTDNEDAVQAALEMLSL